MVQRRAGLKSPILPWKDLETCTEGAIFFQAPKVLFWPALRDDYTTEWAQAHPNGRENRRLAGKFLKVLDLSLGV